MKNLNYIAKTKSGKVIPVTVSVNSDLCSLYSYKVVAEGIGQVELVSEKDAFAIRMNFHQATLFSGAKQTKSACIMIDRDYRAELRDFEAYANEERTKMINAEIDGLVKSNKKLTVVSVSGHMIVRGISFRANDRFSALLERAQIKGIVRLEYSIENEEAVAEMTMAEIIDACNAVDEKEKTAAAAVEKAEIKKIEAAKIEANEKNTEVLMESYPVDCDGSARDCSVDIISTYVRPDGSLKTYRSHCH